VRSNPLHFLGESRGGQRWKCPLWEDLQSLDQLIESNGFICGDKIKRHNRKFYNRRAVLCGDPIEANYYNPNTGTKGGRIVSRRTSVQYAILMMTSCLERHRFQSTEGVIVRVWRLWKNIEQAQKQRKRNKKKQSKEALNSDHMKAPRRS
jgi:hypothetical protein